MPRSSGWPSSSASRWRPTGNLTLDELADRGLDGAAVERLAYSSVVITLAGESYRAKRKRRTLAAVREAA